MFFMCVAVLIAGFIALVKGAGIFVDGSAALARNFRVPGLIIGLTIVAGGTSAPELAVSITAAVQGSNEIALSNVVGSNIFNLLCVLGMCALIHPVSSEKAVLKRDFPLSIGVTALVFLLSCGTFVFSGQIARAGMDGDAGVVGRGEGILLILLIGAYIAYLILDARKHPAPEEDVEKKPLWKCALFIGAGLGLIVAGGGVRRQGNCRGPGHVGDTDRAHHCGRGDVPAGTGDFRGGGPKRGDRPGGGQCGGIQSV